jgi:Alcohol dehydrogenase GroES-like domain/Zinc-binding dehydrogenase
MNAGLASGLPPDRAVPAPAGTAHGRRRLGAPFPPAPGNSPRQWPFPVRGPGVLSGGGFGPPARGGEDGAGQVWHAAWGRPSQKGIVVQAITVRDRTVGAAGLTLSDIPHPHAAENDVIVRVYAAGFTPGELDWPGTWTDRAGRDRTPSVPGHELSGVVAELGYGTTGLTVGQRVFGLADWTRDGSLAEYTAVEARNLAPLPADIDHTVAAAMPISGLTAWQALFDHAGLKTGQTVLIHGAAGGVGSIAVQLAHEMGARVIGTGRAADREAARGLGADVFVDLQADQLEEVGEVDVVFDVIGGRGPRTLGPAGVRRRNAGHDHRPAEGAVGRRPGDLLCRRAGPVPAGGPRPAGPVRAAEADHRGRTAARRGAVRVRSQPPSARQDDHPGHGRRITEGR